MLGKCTVLTHRALISVTKVGRKKRRGGGLEMLDNDKSVWYLGNIEKPFMPFRFGLKAYIIPLPPM